MEGLRIAWAVGASLVSVQHLIPLLLVLTVLWGGGRRFGLPRVFIPDDGRWLDRFWNGVAIGGLFTAIALAVRASDPVRRATKEAGDTMGWSVWILVSLLLVVFAAATVLTSALLGQREMQPADRDPNKASDPCEPDRILDDPLRPTFAQAGQFTSGLFVYPVSLTLLGWLFPVVIGWSPDLYALIAALAALAAVLSVRRTDWRWKPESAAASVSSFLSVVVLAWAAVQYYRELYGVSWTVVVLVLFLTMLAANRFRGDRYALTLEDLGAPEEGKLREPTREAWEKLDAGASGHAFEQEAGDPQPLVIVCCSGGGIRAAVWTIRTLVALEDTCGASMFRPHIIFGASGGMLGALRYSFRENASNDELIADVEKESLNGLIRQLCAQDLPSYVLPFATSNRHRGEVIEETWRENFRLADDSVLRFGDRKPGAPHMVFSPMAVEDARRWIISDLKLTRLTQARGPEIKDTEDPLERYSASAFELSEIFGPEVTARLSLFTATRLSATFPYFMPISALPSSPRRRLVDAGYYDNYGVSLAAEWLEWALDEPERRQWLSEKVSRVVVVQIRDGVLEATQEVGGSRTETNPPSLKQRVLGSLWENFTGPPTALLTYHGAAQLYGNDARLSDVLADINRLKGRRDFATTVSFELGVRTSLSWSLSQGEKDKIETWTQCKYFLERCRALARFLEGRD